MAISRGQLVKELEPGLNALFGLEYKRYENQHAEIYVTESSDRAFEEEVMLSGFANAAVKPEGSGVTFDNAQETYTARYTMETIALAFAITEEAIEDNLYDRLASRYTKALARSMANTKQIKAVDPLINGLPQTGSFTSGDGSALFATNHPTISGTVSNTLTTQADLNETSLEQALIDVAAMTDERGLKIAARGMKLVVPPANQFNAERLLKSQGRVGTADNDINAVKSLGMVPQGYVVNNFLTDTDSWYLITDVPNGMKYFERTPIKTAMEGDFDTGNVRYKARERYRFGVSDYRGIYGVQGA
ncbi:MAG: Mu-like prophage major head subunit gpT family protein [Anaerolineales bacterium]|nr:Mu-like prophage major head subunit gpT family protein [Anaerolineales bacterium]